MGKKVIILGADHAGFKYKEKLKKFFEEEGIKAEDYGAFKEDVSDDYPDYAFKVAERVAMDKNSLGILICGSGAGMIIAANKVKGIRAVEALDAGNAKVSREHNNSNVLGLGARSMSFRRAREIADAWINAKFSRQPRHIIRIKKIESYENDK